MPDPSISPNDEGLDGIDRHPAPVDEGLASWLQIVQQAIGAQNGVQLIGMGPGSLHFAFRGQAFAVTVQRTS